MIKIPGTPEGLPAIEEAIFRGIPINVTLLFSREHYFAAAEAFLRGIERRMEAGLNPDVASVASVFISRWDSAIADKVPVELRSKLGIAMAKRTYKAYRSLLSSPRWQRIYNAGRGPSVSCGPARGPRIQRLPMCFTSNRWPPRSRSTPCPRERSMLWRIMATSRCFCARTEATAKPCWPQFAGAGIDVYELATRLQQEGAKSFVKSWTELMAVIASKTAALQSVKQSHA